MVTSRYRKALQTDVKSSDVAPGSMRSRLLGSFLILGCGVFALVFLVTKSMRAFDGRPWASVGVAALVAGVLLAFSVYSIIGYHADLRKSARRLSEPEPVEVLEVRASSVIDVQAPGSTGPALCFELADGQVLLLYGQWLLEHCLYRAPRPADDGNQEHFNLLDEPHAFPSEHFSIHRWRGEARPFWIEVHGRYLPPQASPVQLGRTARVRELELVPGSPGSLQEDIDRAFRQPAA
jgi:hypothetical protein